MVQVGHIKETPMTERRKKKPCEELPVLFARLPHKTHALACALAEADQRSVSQWVARLIEAQRPRLLSDRDDK